GEAGIENSLSKTKYSGEFKLSVLNYRHIHQVSYREVAEHFGIKQGSTIANRQRAYDTQGFEGLNVPPEYYRKFVLLEDSNNFGGLSIDEIYSHQDLIIYLANLFYDINLNEQDIKVFRKNLISNKENQENFNISKSIDSNKLMAVVTSLITSAKIENSQKN